MFDRSTVQRESTVLPGLAPDPFVEIHPTDAGRLSLSQGEAVTVTTAAGSLALTAKVTTDTPEGSVFVPAGYNEAPVTALLTPGARIAACRIDRQAT
jgi:formate dehydrogenase major subunit